MREGEGERSGVWARRLVLPAQHRGQQKVPKDAREGDEVVVGGEGPGAKEGRVAEGGRNQGPVHPCQSACQGVPVRVSVGKGV